MQQRIDASKVSPDAFKAVSALQSYVDRSGLERRILELVKIRASQINGCAYCLAMHTRDARKLGETDERMHLLNAWRETPLYNERERAALAWTKPSRSSATATFPMRSTARSVASFPKKNSST